jgi:EAL domain-containing protein (putative c-di-GMP-specific phosphodiesterase class I)/FixJ family two-component response regulator
MTDTVSQSSTSDRFLCFLVDDDAAIRRMLGQILTKHDVQTREFDSVEALAGGLQSSQPDLIFLDLRLGGSDAVEAIKMLSKSSYSGLLQIISGLGPDLLESIQRLCGRYGLATLPPLQKPFRRAVVDRVIESARAKRNERHAASAEPTAGQAQPAPAHCGVLEEALRHGWTEFWYQPKIDLRTGALVGAEALLRVNHPEHGVILPDEILGDAGAEALDRLTEAAIRKALVDWSWFMRAGVNLRLAVNAPLASLSRVPVAAIVRDGRPADEAWPGLVVEITEGEAIRATEAVDEIATQLSIYNVQLSIDDFGLGHSSLSLLRDLAFSELKLDGSFIRDSATNPAHQAICQTAVDLARRFRARVVAEGIEQKADLHFLQSIGCEAGQGFLFSPAVPAADLLELHRRNQVWLDPVGSGAGSEQAGPDGASVIRNWNFQGAEALTAREREVLQCIVLGRSSREAAADLNISHRTVEVYRARIMLKLGAKNTADMARIVFTK